MNKQELRRIVEITYLYCWGKEGSHELRQEWHQLWNNVYSTWDIGEFLYTGPGGGIVWIP